MKKSTHKKEALVLIDKYLGGITESLFDQYYEGRSVEEVFYSLKEIFLKMFGPNKTKAILADFAKKYHLAIIFEDE